jgi:alpha-1,2-mannosyltransferase
MAAIGVPMISSTSLKRACRAWPYWTPLLLAAMAGLLAFCATVDQVAYAEPNDFTSFFYAGRAAAQRMDLYDTPLLRTLAAAHNEPSEVFPYLYPPFLAYVLGAFGSMPVRAAHKLWIHAMLGAPCVVGLIAWAAYRMWRGSDVNPRDSLLTPIAIAAISIYGLPIGDNIKMAQVNLFVMAFVALSAASYFSGRHWAAGALLAPAVLIKLTPLAFVVFFLARRALRAVGGFALCAVGLVVWTVGLGAAPAWIRYVHRLPEMGLGHEIAFLFPLSTLCNGSLSGELARLGVGPHTALSGLSTFVPVLLLAVSTLCSLRARGPRAEALAFALFPPIMIVASPLLYRHHIVFLFPAAVIWLTWAWVEMRTAVFCCAVLLLTLSGVDWPVLYTRLPRPFCTVPFQAMNLYAVIALWGFGVGAWYVQGTGDRSAHH